MELKITFTDQKISNHGGAILMKKLLNNMNFREILSQAGLPEQGSNRGYKPEELIEVFMTGIWCGAVKYSDLEIVRGDELLGGILRVRKIGGHKSFIRYFRKFTEAKNIEVFTRLNKWFFSNLKKESITLDVDSTVLERYGTQQGSMKGYSDRKRGRNSHHPILAMIPEERKVVNFWLRSGNTNTANNFISFFENTLERLEGKKVGLLRADSGFFSDKILTFLEEREKPVNYILAVRLYKPLKRLILRDAEFVSVTRGVEMAEIYTSLGGWKKKRR
ncbi:MAG: transposase, partial [Ignavibacteriaceae bacterium]|nr:transposase [Ignavibacteriaceae bacterium]